MLLALAGSALVEDCLIEGHCFLTVDSFDPESVVVVLNACDTGNAFGFYLLYIELWSAGDTYYIDVVAVNAVLLGELVETVSIAGLEECEYLSLLFALLNEILGDICGGEVIENEFLFELFCGLKNSRGDVISEFSPLPADNTADCTVSEELLCLVYHCFLHLRSSNLRLGPSFLTASVNSFIVAANFAPSAADTHSTRVRSRSMPRKSSILKRRVILLLVK